jgi:hypothetical protein
MNAERIVGKFEFAVKLFGGIMAKVSGSFTILVNPPVQALALVPPGGALPDETVGSVAAGGVSATGGVPPYSFVVTNGVLPPGVTLDPATGQLSGTPTQAGTAAVEITVTDSGA